MSRADIEKLIEIHGGELLVLKKEGRPTRDRDGTLWRTQEVCGFLATLPGGLAFYSVDGVEFEEIP